MEPTFDQLPKAVADLQNSVNEIKRILLEKDTRNQVPISQERDDLLSVDLAAKLLGLTKGSLYGLVHLRKVPYAKRGKKLYFSEKELRGWISSSRRQTVAEIQDEAIKSLTATSI